MCYLLRTSLTLKFFKMNVRAGRKITMSRDEKFQNTHMIMEECARYKRSMWCGDVRLSRFLLGLILAFSDSVINLINRRITEQHR